LLRGFIIKNKQVKDIVASRGYFRKLLFFIGKVV